MYFTKLSIFNQQLKKDINIEIESLSQTQIF